MQQLGAGFINSFLLPYIKNQILGNIKNDTRLQNMFRYDKVLRPDELEGLEDDYFVDTGTVLETDASLRRAFWKEFNEFVESLELQNIYLKNIEAEVKTPNFEPKLTVEIESKSTSNYAENKLSYSITFTFL